MQNLNDLVAFVRVVEAGGISAAARELKMSPSLVSRRLRHLEEDMGVQLLNRSTRHIALTDAGEGFYKSCARAIASLEAARAAAVGYGDEPRGTLKVHAAVGVGQGMVTEAVIAFKHAFPDVEIDLNISSDRVNLLKSGYDILIKTSTLADSSLDVREFGPVRYVVVASPVYLHRAGVPECPPDLSRYECLIQYGRRPPTEWRFIGPQGTYGVKVSGSFWCSSAIAIRTAAARGLGIARVPKYVFHERAHDGELKVIFDDCVAAERTLKAYYPRSRHLPAKVQAFLDCLEHVDSKRTMAQLPFGRRRIA